MQETTAASSRSAMFVGSALTTVPAKLVAEAMDRAAAFLDVPRSDLTLRRGSIEVGQPGQSMAWRIWLIDTVGRHESSTPRSASAPVRLRCPSHRRRARSSVSGWRSDTTADTPSIYKACGTS